MRLIHRVVNILYALGLVRTANRCIRWAKNSYGFFNTYFTGSVNYTQSWWDENFYGSTILDNTTISPSIDRYSTGYHYASIELLITKELFSLREDIKLDSVLDVGSGAGHWIDFYQRIGAKNLYGIDVSKKAIESLRVKYPEPNVRLINGTIESPQQEIDADFDVVNAIGVMFHIVDDAEWRATLEKTHELLTSGGVLVVGGHFGMLDGLNVQVDDNLVNKRLRSGRNWKATLSEIGFHDIKIIKNNTAYKIKRPLPENNLLIAIKR